MNEPQSLLIENFIENNENTMNAETSASTGAVLIRLARQYAKYSQINSVISEGIITFHVEALHKEVQLQNDAILQEAWGYMQHEMKKPPTLLDRVTCWEDNKEVTLIIDIKTTLALVYAALNDQEIFKFASEKDRAERLLTLFNSLKSIYLKKRCSQGIRHEIVGALTGVYPNVWIISDIKIFLVDLITEYVLGLSKKIRKEKGQEIYLQVVLSSIEGNIHTELSKALSDKTALIKFIGNKFRENGINPLQETYTKLITTYVNSLSETAPLPAGSSILGHQIRKILLTQTAGKFLKNREKSILLAKAWIKEDFILENPEHQTNISSFAAVEEAYELYQHAHLSLRIQNEVKISSEEIDGLFSDMQRYYENSCLSNMPIKASSELLLKIEQFKNVYHTFKKDPKIDWIENIFAQWKLAMDNHQEDIAQALYIQLLDPGMQEKYQVNDDLLKNIFNQDSAEIYLSAYIINRVFLHALFIKSEDRSPLFIKCFNTIHDFVSKGFHSEDNKLLTLALKRDSYPKNLLTQLKDPESDIFIPAPHFLSSKEKFLTILRWLPDHSWKSFIQKMDKKIIKNILEVSNLTNIIYEFSEDQKILFLDALGKEILNDFINDGHKLGAILDELPGEKCPEFLEILGKDLLKKAIKNSYQLEEMLNALDGNKRITNYISSKNKCQMIFAALGEDLLAEIIKNKASLIQNDAPSNDNSEVSNGIKLWLAIFQLSETEKIEHLQKLPKEFFKQSIEGGVQLWLVLSQLTPDQQVGFLDSLGGETLKHILQNKDGLACVEEILSEKLMTPLTVYFDIVSVKTAIVDYMQNTSSICQKDRLWQLPTEQTKLSLYSSLIADISYGRNNIPLDILIYALLSDSEIDKKIKNNICSNLKYGDSKGDGYITMDVEKFTAEFKSKLLLTFENKIDIDVFIKEIISTLHEHSKNKTNFNIVILTLNDKWRDCNSQVNETYKAPLSGTFY